MPVYGPADEWPKHRQACWRDTLRKAREHGWYLERTSDHAWGVLRCPGDGGCAPITIFSTGRGAENVARATKRRVERCRHGAKSPVAKVQRHLDSAERFANAAEELLRRGECYASVEEALNMASSALTQAEQEALLNRIDELPAVEEPAEGEVLQQLDGADRELGEARVGLADVSGEVGKPYRKRMSALRARVTELRSRLEGWPSNVRTIRPGAGGATGESANA